MIKRLRFKFVCINMVIFTTMLCVICALIISFMSAGVEIQSQNMMQIISENALRMERQEMAPVEFWRPHFLVRISNRGEILAVDKGYFEEMEESVLLQYTQEALSREEDYGRLKEHHLRFQKRKIPTGQVLVFMDTSLEEGLMENLVKTCIIISIASFAVFLIISHRLARWTVLPVEKAWDQQRRFVADASHELKTPLTVIMTNAELLQSDTGSEAENRRCADSILTMSRQMRGLVESLLELARVDNGAVKKNYSRVDLSELVSEGLLPFEPVYFERELLLQSHIQEGIQVRGSQTHLNQVLDILLDNGAKYASPQGTVWVRLVRQGNQCLLSVATPGEPISREDLKNIFQRFYRIDKVRSMNHSYGLGLSIADSIVKEHGGRIWAESREGINTFYVQLAALQQENKI